MAIPFNFDIIEFNKAEFYNTDKAKKSGMIKLEITAIDDIYIGSGFFGVDNKKSYKETIKMNGKAVIPGSSIKGCVRNLARIISFSCLSNMDKVDGKGNDKTYYRVSNENKNNIVCGGNSGRRCIACDMFGMMGRKSKIDFQDMISDNAKYKIKEMNVQFSPNIKDSKYQSNNIIKGRKLYRNHCELYKAELRESVELIESGAVFEGKVYFRNLTDEEIALLCFALGLGENINIKLGGYKNDGCGQVQVRGVLNVDGNTQNAKECALSYKTKYSGSKMEQTISKVEKCLMPFGGEN